MELSYWQSRWRKDAIGWHMEQVYPLLKRYWSRLQLAPEARVMVPLCGKSLDMDWLLQRGHQIIGVDAAPQALEAVIQRSSFDFERAVKGSFSVFTSSNGALQLWCGNLLKLQPAWLPTVDAIYDKAALISQPREKRARYAAHLASFATAHTQWLLNTFEYKQHEMNGPPFAVFADELATYFGARYRLQLLHERDQLQALSGFQRRGLSSYLTEKLYTLQPRAEDSCAQTG